MLHYPPRSDSKRLGLTPERITAWVTKNFPDCKPRKGGVELRICNPFDGDTHHKFNININSGKCHDWRGDSWAGIDPKTKKLNGRTFIRFVQEYLTWRNGSCSFPQAIADVAGTASVARFYLTAQQPNDEPEEQDDISFALPDTTEPLHGSAHPKAADMVRSWLRSRAVSDEICNRYRICHDGLDVVWPYYEFSEVPVYWQSRSSVSKSFNFPKEVGDVGKGNFLYGFDQAEPATHVILVEAIFGALTLQSQCLASGGADITEEQVKKLRLLGPREGVILAPDNDQAGLKSIIRNAEKLSVLGVPIFWAVPPFDGGKYWNDIAKSYIQKGCTPAEANAKTRAIFDDLVHPLNMASKMAIMKLTGKR